MSLPHPMRAVKKGNFSRCPQVGALIAEHEWVRALHQELLKRSGQERPPFKRLVDVRVGYVFARIEQHLTGVSSPGGGCGGLNGVRRRRRAPGSHVAGVAPDACRTSWNRDPRPASRRRWVDGWAR